MKNTLNRISKNILVVFVALALIVTPSVALAGDNDGTGGSWNTTTPRTTVTTTTTRTPVYGSYPSTPTYSTPRVSANAYATANAYSTNYYYPSSYSYPSLSYRSSYQPSYYPSYGNGLNLSLSYNPTKNNNTNVNNNTNYNYGGSITKPPKGDRPVCELEADDTTIEEGDETTLSWDTEDADNVTLTGFGNVSDSGSEEVTLNSSKTFTLRATNQYGSTTCTETINVEEEEDAPRCELTASPRTIEEGDETTLSWDTSGDVDSASINQGVGSVDEDGGDEDVSPDEDTTYRLTVRGPGGTDTCSVTVRVNEENDLSSVALYSEPEVVYLSDLPYTGLDLGQYAAFYWSALILAVGGIAYAFYSFGMPFVFAKVRGTREEEFAPVAVEESVATSALPSTVDVYAFLSALTKGNHDGAYDVLTSAAKSGVDANVFLARAESMLGSNDENVARMTSGLSLEAVAELRNSIGYAIKA